MNSAQTKAAGGRRHTIASQRAADLIEAYGRRHSFASRLEVVCAFKRAAGLLGFDQRLTSTLDYLVSFTQPQDWEGGPITVWPSNERMIDQLGAGKRTIQSWLAQLHEAGLIAFIDSANGKRYGHRDRKGYITEAYGIDLRPLAQRYEEFCEAAERADQLFQQRKRLRRQVTIMRRKIEQVCHTGHELEDMPSSRWNEWALEADGVASGAAPERDVDLLSRVLDTLAEIHGQCIQAFQTLAAAQAQTESSFHRADNSPQGAESCTQLTSTNASSLIEKHCGASNTSSRRTENPADAVPPEKPAPGRARPPNAAPDGTEKEHEAVIASATRNLSNLEPAAKRPGTPVETVREHLRTYRITPAMVAEACPPLADALWTLSAGEDACWQDVVDGANALLPQLGISQHAWGEACYEMSREGAAVAVAIIAAKHQSGAVRRPGGYLRWITREIVAGGVLDLAPKLYGLRVQQPPNRHPVERPGP